MRSSHILKVLVLEALSSDVLLQIVELDHLNFAIWVSFAADQPGFSQFDLKVELGARDPADDRGFEMADVGLSAVVYILD